jgi:hypothetical protein
MAQTGYTPISLYYTSTASAVPTSGNLVNGELAININTADGKLFYKDSAGVVQTLATKGSAVVGGATTQVQYNLSGALAGSSSFVFDGTNVGIGTNNPQSRLHVNSATNGTGLLLTPNTGGTAGDYTQLGFGNNATSGVVYGGIRTAFLSPGGTSAVSMQFWTDTGGNSYLERARIGSSGEFIVGNTTTPLGTRTNGNYWYADGGYNSRTIANHRDWGIDVTSGSVINFYSDNGSTLVYAGTISVNGNTTAYTSISDYRLKENIAPLTNALDKVSKLKPVTYTFKDGGQSSQGFIAHELQAVVPDCVTGEKDAMRIEKYEISPATETEYDENGKIIKEAVEAVMGEREVPAYQGVDTSFLIATLTAAIQELNAKVTALEAKVG